MTPNTANQPAQSTKDSAGPPSGGRAEAGPSLSSERLESAVFVAAALSLLAAIIHLWAAPEHLEHWWGYGAFFLIAATAQGFFGVAILRWPFQPLALAGIFGNLVIVFMYVVTRTWGVPLGPEAGMMEDPGLLDMAATAAELGLVIALVALLGGACRRWTLNALLCMGVTIWVLWLVGGAVLIQSPG